MSSAPGPRDERILGWGERLPTGQPDDVAEPGTGSALVLAGLVSVVGGASPWVDIRPLHRTIYGPQLGWLMLALGVLTVGAGAVVLARRGRPAVSIAALVMGAVQFVIMVVESESIREEQARRFTLQPADVTTRFGVGVALAGAVLTIAAAGLALARRNTPPAARR